MSGLLIAAPSSGAGKTTVMLGLLRALKRRGLRLAPGKAGPDYIDPAFHAAASGEACLNFDPWAMRPELLRANVARHGADGRMPVVEAMMGLFDGAVDGRGSAADLAALLGLHVVLVVDCARLSHSVAALVGGYHRHRADVMVAGVILNRVASDRHVAILRAALAAIAMPVLGVLRTDAALALPERHLGLVQAGEHRGLDDFIEHAGMAVAAGCDLDALIGLVDRPSASAVAKVAPLPPLGSRIAVACDIAFAFSYEHILLGWRGAGADITFFSPFADEAPVEDADAVYLPGGYPELHAGKLAAAGRFRQGMCDAAARGARIFGECGGYIVLGEGLIDAAGERHAMLGLLPLVTSFQNRRRSLGYRHVAPVAKTFFEHKMTAHEFHYATIVWEGEAEHLFAARDAAGNDLGAVGLARSAVAGSFLHLIDIAGGPA